MRVGVVLLGGLLLAWPTRPRRPHRVVGTAGPWRPDPDRTVRRATDRRLPAIGIAAVLTLAVSPVIGLLVLGAASAWPRVAARRAVAGRRRRSWTLCPRPRTSWPWPWPAA